MKARALTLALVVGILIACGGVERLVARHVMVATLFGTPDKSIGPEALGLDAGFGPDGGFVIAGQTAAFVFFGELASASLDAPPSGLADAGVVLQQPGGVAQRVLQELGQGAYALTSVQDPALSYQDAVDYQFRATYASDIYTATISDVPSLETIPELHPPAGYFVQPPLQPFTLTRPAPPAGTERPLGFVTVFALDGAGGPGAVTYTNVPSQPLDLLRLAAQPAAWKQTQITIPAQAFPSGNSSYLIVFQAAKLSGDMSDNLSPLSVALAGTADLGVLRTTP